MSRSAIQGAIRAHARAFSFAAALAVAVAGSVTVAGPVAANHGGANCAVGGNLEDGGTGSIGCAFGGLSGTALAGTIDVSDPAATVAIGYGGACGAPGGNAAGVIDVDESGMIVAGGFGGSYPYPAANAAGSYP